jgi:hypothetical protein
MKYLIPSLGQFLISMMCKFPNEMMEHRQSISEICIHLMSTEVRMESTGLQILMVLFERLGMHDD